MSGDLRDGVLIAVDDPRRPDVRALLERHLAFSRGESPPVHVHALDVDGLLDPAVTLFSMRRDGALLGVGALRRLDDAHVELKSMHTVDSERRRGLGALMVEHLLGVATERGYRRVSLETGTMEAFAPARRLYERAGFRVCPPFGSYTVNPYSVCMTTELVSRRGGTSSDRSRSW